MLPHRLSRLVSTFTFRLALVYVGLFALSIILLFGFIYTSASKYLENQVVDSVRMQYEHLLNEYRENGSAGVERRIEELIAADKESASVYLLINKESERLAGNLEAWPKYASPEERDLESGGSWIQFSIEGNAAPVDVKAISVPLSKWRTLLVGQSLQDRHKIIQTIVQTFWASLAITVFMALAGALIITRSVIRRINVINRSAQAIMHGDLSARIPFAKGGDEFDDLSGNLNEMLDKIEALLKSLKDFANNIAHDLRSPLTRIISRTEAGMRGLSETSAAHRLLEKNVQEMTELIATFNAILKISELEANTDFRDFAPCNLASLVADLVDFYEPYAAQKNIAIHNELSAAPVISGDRHLLTQAFANLIDNAIKFTPAGGVLRIYVQAKEGRTIISIEDNGPGIPLQFQDKVFEKFFRMEQSRNTKGNGLGLSLVAAIARLHNAEVQFEDCKPGLRVNLVFQSAD